MVAAEFRLVNAREEIMGDLSNERIADAVSRAEVTQRADGWRRVASWAVYLLETEIGRRLTGSEIQLVAEAAGMFWR